MSRLFSIGPADVRRDPSRLGAALVDVLIAGYAILAVSGVAEAFVLGEPGGLVQPVAASAFVIWGVVMRRRGRPRPLPMLLLSMLLALGYLVAAAIDPDLGDVTDSSPVAIVVAAGVLSIAVARRHRARVGVVALTATGVAVVVVQVAIQQTTAAVVVDAVAAVVAMSIAFGMVWTIGVAAEDATARYRGLVESTPVAVVDVDLGAWRDGADEVHMGPMNPVAAEILGYPPDVSEVMLSRARIPHAFGRLLDEISTTETGTTVLSFRRSDRVFKVGWRVDPVTRRVVMSGTDISAQRRAEDALSGKVSARDRFIASVSHELRTPLAGALGLLELVAAGRTSDSVEREEMISLALAQVRDMTDIVEDLLVASRAADGRVVVRPVEMDLGEAVEAVLSVTEAPFDTDIAAGVFVIADPVRVRQIVKNLFTNAVRHGGSRRRVVVDRGNGKGIVEMRDSGPPLDRDFATRMFQPYQHTTSENIESVGLGLTVARTLAEQMGGTLEYVHDGEVVFRLALPLAAEIPG